MRAQTPPAIIISVLWLAATQVARADVGFDAAASQCRALVPGQTLLALRQQQRNGLWVYEGDLVRSPPTDLTTATIDRDTGAMVDIASAPMTPDERSAAQFAIQRLHYAMIDFAEAWQTANASAGRTDTERIELLYEAGVLAFRVRYFAGAALPAVDSITGGVIPPVVPGFGIEPTVSVAEMAGAIAHAQFASGAEWKAIEATAIQRFDGVTVRVLLANRFSGQLAQPEIVQGFFIPSPVFAPLGAQAARAAAVAPASPVVCDAIAALSAVQRASPGPGVNRLRLEPIDHLGLTSYEWIASIVDATESEQDAHLDATSPAARKSPVFAAPVDLAVGDITRDGTVDARDLTEILAYWGVVNPILDIDASGTVGPGDLTIVLGDWTITAR